MIDGVRFLGATLWTDYCLFGDRFTDAAIRKAEQSMNDHRLIRYRDRGWQAADAASEHTLSRSWLEAQIAARNGASFVVVTHTAPGLKSISAQYKNDLLTAAFASDLEDLVRSTDLWVHGHTHVSSDYRLGRTRVVNNPRGYVAYGEGEDFAPSLVWQVP